MEYNRLLDYFSRRQLDYQVVTTILACLGPLITIVVYQWKVMAETRKTLDVMGALIYDRDIMKKLIVHLATEDPRESAKAIRLVEKRIEKLEDIMSLLASKRHLQKLIDGKIGSLKEHYDENRTQKDF